MAFSHSSWCAPLDPAFPLCWAMPVINSTPCSFSSWAALQGFPFVGWCGLGRAPSAGVPGRPVEGTSWCFGSCHLGFCDFICCWSFFCCWGLCQCLALLLVLAGQKLGKEACFCYHLVPALTGPGEVCWCFRVIQ